jgi:hypothetical protein
MSPVLVIVTDIIVYQAFQVPSRFERGNVEMLRTIRELSRTLTVSLSVAVVQPGLSRGNATRDQL